MLLFHFNFHILKFLLSRKLSVRRIATVTDNDMEEIESALRRLSSWPSSYKVATQKKKAVNRRKDMEEHLDSASFRQLRENKFAEDIQKTFASINSDVNKTVDIQTFANKKSLNVMQGLCRLLKILLMTKD